MDNWITLSAQMRQLFIETMDEDLLNTERALHAKDVQGLVRHLHRMNGSLASVRAQALCAACNHLEFTLNSHPLTDDTRRELVAFMSRLRAALLILSEDLIT
ncbi:Hpt domain-containing protein [Pseudomonas sp. HY2-MNA-CIBAN-0224]